MLTKKEKKLLDELGNNWFVRNDENGISYGGYKCAPVGQDKIKVREFRVLFEHSKAVEALFYVCRGAWPGSLVLIDATLPGCKNEADIREKIFAK